MAVSEEESIRALCGTFSSGIRSASSTSSSSVLVRLPLWHSARPPPWKGRKVGWALPQVLAPVVE